MRLRKAEVHEHAVAHVLRYEAIEALHSLGDALLIGRNDLPQVLRVHPRRQCRRTDKVREHDRDLAALGGVSPFTSPVSVFVVAEEPVANSWIAANIMRRCPSRTPDVLQVLVRQMTKRGDADAVFSKALRVLGHAEFFEPVRNVLH